MRVLIIDDDADTRLMLRELLAANGHEVFEAENGNAGLRVFEKSLPELVVTDIVMPDREGISTIMELRKKKANTKIIAMSGGKRNSPEYLDWARKLGADKTLDKPLDLELFLRTVAELAG
jgi:DNA-binding response OmpR family regulator